MNIDEWASSVNGRYIDRDGAFGAQCHDLWLDYANRVYGMPIGLGWAPGNGSTDEVWTGFPATNGIQNYFVKLPASNIQKGDVVFWAEGSRNYPGSHVAIAMSPSSGGVVDVMTQNPGATKRATLTLAGAVGVLRSKTAANSSNITTSQGKSDEPMLMIHKQTSAGTMYALFSGNFWLEFVGGDTANGFAGQCLLNGSSQVVSESFWDYCKAAATKPVQVNVNSTSGASVDVASVAKAVNDEIAKRMGN